jgi:putative FmdB family regulatory protein
MPFYEYSCTKCGAREEVFARSFKSEVAPPACKAAGREKGHNMQRVMSGFIRQRTLGDQLAEAEAKWGKEVESSMGPGPDVGKLARRYETLTKDMHE